MIQPRVWAWEGLFSGRVTLFGVKGKTASGKVRAPWGTDYLHLAKIEGRWNTMNVLWQSPTPTGEAAN